MRNDRKSASRFSVRRNYFLRVDMLELDRGGLLCSETHNSGVLKMELPGGRELHCKIYYKIFYVSAGKIEDASVELSAPCLLLGLDSLTGHAVAISRIQAARELMWGDWLDYVREHEKLADISSLMISHTEYWTDSDGAIKVTNYIDGYVRSIPGYSQVPSKF